VNKAYVTDGDVGCGAPGSLSWHKCAVAEMSRDERVAYFMEVLTSMTFDDALEFMTFLISSELTYEKLAAEDLRKIKDGDHGP